MLRHKTRQWLWSLMLWLLGNNLLSVLLLTVTQSAASRGRGATGPVSAPGSARPQYNLGSAAHSYLHYPHYLYTLIYTILTISIHSYLHYSHYLYTHIYTILTIYTLISTLSSQSIHSIPHLISHEAIHSLFGRMYEDHIHQSRNTVINMSLKNICQYLGEKNNYI